MKTILTSLMLIILSIGFAQSGQLNGVAIFNDDKLEIPGMQIELVKDGKLIQQTQTDADGKYGFGNVPFGVYNIKMSYVGYRIEILDNIVIDKEKTVLDFTYPKPCIDNGKVCPKKHKDNIIPIVYGFPDKKLAKKAKKGKVKLGGCNSYCEKWHCVLHDLDF